MGAGAGQLGERGGGGRRVALRISGCVAGVNVRSTVSGM